MSKRIAFLLVTVCLLASVLLAPQAGLAAPPQVTLTTEVVGPGLIDPAGGTFKKRTSVTLTATADPGWKFDHWEGDLTGAANPATFKMTSDKHVIAVFIEDNTPPPPPPRAGLRSSPYGISPLPPADWWVNSTTDMASRFEGGTPEVVWTVGEIMFPVACQLSFPNPTPGIEYPDVLFKDTDENEAYFDAFDQAGVQVWLQVEPGNADVSILIDLVLAQYGHHPSVIGFGVDVEWYKTKVQQNGKAVTDAEAQAWAEQVRSYDPDYLLFTKHWLAERMPPTYRTGMVFISDSQAFRSLGGMVSEFQAWGQTFAPAGVGFQYGYARDKKWWRKLSDPPGDIGQAILANVPNTTDLVWVDFTADEIWPIP